MTLIDQIRKEYPTRKLTKINIEDIQLEEGLTGHIFYNDISKCLPWLAIESWIKDTWTYASEYLIKMPQLGKEIKKKQRDISIMEAFLLLNPSQAQWRSINRVCMEIHAFMLSNRQFIVDEAQQKGQRQFGLYNGFKWPTKTHTSTLDWTIWRKFLCKLCSTDNFRLTIELGEGTIKDSHFYQHGTGSLITQTTYFCIKRAHNGITMKSIDKTDGTSSHQEQ